MAIERRKPRDRAANYGKLPDTQERVENQREAQRQAWPALWSRMSGLAASTAPRLPDSALDSMVSAIEVERSGPSYMADTLELLAPLGELVLLLGSDQYAALDAWHDPARVRRLARIAVAERPGGPAVTGGCERIAMVPVDVASSGIRRRVHAGEPIDTLVTPSVGDLIAREGLYLDATVETRPRP
jgi:nicotinic acid mononucleotide adenylyltransferase